MFEWEPAAVAAAQGVALVIIAVGLLQQALHLVQLLIAGRVLMKEPAGELDQLWRRSADAAPPISLLVPAYNEELSIVQSVRSLLQLQYPTFEVVVVNDGSKDGTLQALKQAFDLQPSDRFYDLSCPCQPIRGLYSAPNQPRLVVVDKENGGKADALNAGINISRAPIVCSMDADSLLEPDALLRACQPFIEDPERTVAVGGTIRIVNGCRTSGGRVVEVGAPKNLLALIQTVEYLRAFLMARLAFSRIGVLLIISGAFGLFSRAAVIEVGGYSLGTVGEDMELIVKLHRKAREEGRPYRIGFVPEPVCWTEAPESMAVLARQRARWHRGSMETFAKHKDMLFNPRYGRIGVLGMGYVLLTDVLGPIIEVIGYVLVPVMWALGLLSWAYFLAFVAVTFALGVAVSVGALALEEMELRRFPRARDLWRLFGAAVIENFGYRQLSNFWRLRGLGQWMRRSHGWGEMTRTGFRGG